MSPNTPRTRNMDNRHADLKPEMCRMQELLEKDKLHSNNNVDKVKNSLNLQLQESDEIRMRKEFVDKNRELRGSSTVGELA
ncbi:hypothetical protein M8C21_030177 [Ambrosia artemisiifolia]|uniref:Uncharacterized protein n=1 Tax=Ambrosia artemisiifolia TaxID=4212 RepID=A0AAD5C0T3_AMBAR|nr:hypothetical protein M8C21_030177 [Ambrosia artemisiifolia]